MPPKYSHVKKRSAAGLLKPGASTPTNLIRETYDPNNPHGHQQLYQQHIQLNNNHFPILGIQPNSILPKIDKELSQAMAAVAHLERAIARTLLLRYEYDIARLYSTRVHVISITQIPILVARLTELCGPGWVAHNSENEEIKDFFRAIIGMDMREAGERVATKSVLWSYTALRRFVRFVLSFYLFHLCTAHEVTRRSPTTSPYVLTAAYNPSASSHSIPT
jgi:hypothetical protein